MTVAEAIFTYFIVCVAATFIYGLRRYKRMGYHLLDDMDGFVFVEFENEVIPLRKRQAREWAHTSVSTKRDIIKNAKILVSKGKLTKIKLEGGKVLYATTDKGKQIDWHVNRYYLQKSKDGQATDSKNPTRKGPPTRGASSRG